MERQLRIEANFNWGGRMEIEKGKPIEEIRIRKGCKRKGLGFKYLPTEGPLSQYICIYIYTLTFLRARLYSLRAHARTTSSEGY